MTLDVYRQAFAQAEVEGIEQASIDEIFLPEVPVVLPTFLENRLLTVQSEASIGHIDVAFDITKLGRGENIEILSTTRNMVPAIQRELVSLIERSVFRPRVKGGQVVEESRVAIRYFVNQ